MPRPQEGRTEADKRQPRVDTERALREIPHGPPGPAHPNRTLFHECSHSRVEGRLTPPHRFERHSHRAVGAR